MTTGRRLAGGAALVVCAVGLLPGCYERVVGVKGPGAKAVDVYEPNLKEDQRIPIADDLEDAVFGPKEDSARRKTGRTRRLANE